VDGISDVDALMILSRRDLAGLKSREVLELMANRISQRLPNTPVTVGRLAVTVKFEDMEVQVLPAIHASDDGIRIPSTRNDGWSTVVRPEMFAQKLREVNARQQFGVVPAIKLFKVIQETRLPEDGRLTGYHVESLAIEAFKTYEGPRSRKDMLQHLVTTAADRVNSPITEITGQSLHVDDYLDEQGPEARGQAANYLRRLSTRMANADAAKDSGFWAGLLQD